MNNHHGDVHWFMHRIIHANSTLLSQYPATKIIKFIYLPAAGGMLSSRAKEDLDYLRQGMPEASAEQEQDLAFLQEALLLIRGLLGEAATHAATLDDLTANRTSTRISLALTSKLLSS